MFKNMCVDLKITLFHIKQVEYHENSAIHEIGNKS